MLERDQLKAQVVRLERDKQVSTCVRIILACAYLTQHVDAG